MLTYFATNQNVLCARATAMSSHNGTNAQDDSLGWYINFLTSDIPFESVLNWA